MWARFRVVLGSFGPRCYTRGVGAPPAPREATSFGAELRRLRLQAGLTRELHAERAGLGVSTLKALETGQRRRPHPSTVVALATALGVPLVDRTRLLQLASGPAAQPRVG